MIFFYDKTTCYNLNSLEFVLVLTIATNFFLVRFLHFHLKFQIIHSLQYADLKIQMSSVSRNAAVQLLHSTILLDSKRETNKMS